VRCVWDVRVTGPQEATTFIPDVKHYEVIETVTIDLQPTAAQAAAIQRERERLAREMETEVQRVKDRIMYGS